MRALLVALCLIVPAAPALAQIDFSGAWASLYHEDLPERLPGPELGDYSGIPLTDDDRWPWLTAIAAWIDEGRASGKPRVVGCSALKRRYRDVLIGARRDVRLVYLHGTKAVIAARMAASERA